MSFINKIRNFFKRYKEVDEKLADQMKNSNLPEKINNFGDNLTKKVNDNLGEINEVIDQKTKQIQIEHEQNITKMKAENPDLDWDEIKRECNKYKNYRF